MKRSSAASSPTGKVPAPVIPLKPIMRRLLRSMKFKDRIIEQPVLPLGLDNPTMEPDNPAGAAGGAGGDYPAPGILKIRGPDHPVRR